MSQTDPINYGYARAAIGNQLEGQLDALYRYGVTPERVFTDTGAGKGRPGFKEVLSVLRPGAKLVVWKIDRLGSNLSELIQTTDLVRKSGAELIALADGIDTSDDNAVYRVIGLLARLERDMIVERTKLGLEEAKGKGKMPGRRSHMTPQKRIEIIGHMRAGLSFEKIAPLVGISKSTLYNYGDDLRAELAVIEAADFRTRTE